ncbi:MAG: hypothetical protein AB7J19_12135, partial [Beijerinckiaceae bacterium]
GPEIAVTANVSAHWFRHLVSGYAGQAAVAAAPASISAMTEFDGCNFPRPEGQERIAIVFSEQVTQNIPVHSVLPEDIAAGSNRFVSETYINGTKVYGNSEPANATQYKLAEIVVTDTTGPLYLVLATGAFQKVLWNIHIGKNVKLSKIAVITETEAGVANVPAKVPVYVLKGRRVNFCRAGAARRPQESWILRNRSNCRPPKNIAHEVANALDLTYRSRPAPHEWRTSHVLDMRYVDFRNWVQRNFEVDVDNVLVGASIANNFLVGPPVQDLSARISYKPYWRSNVVFSDPDNLVFNEGSAAQTASLLESRKKAILQGLTGRPAKVTIPSHQCLNKFGDVPSIRASTFSRYSSQRYYQKRRVYYNYAR